VNHKGGCHCGRVRFEVDAPSWLSVSECAIGESAGESDLFSLAAPPQEEARISAEELKSALDGDKERRLVLLDLCQPRDLPRRADVLAALLCMRRMRCRAGSMNCPASGDRGLLHLRVSGQRQACDRVKKARL
jgi:hypothetical protein